MATPSSPLALLPRFGYVGVGSALPPTELSNHDLEAFVDTSDDWIRKRTGIRTRRVLVDGESLLDLAVGAAWRALESAGVDAEEIDDIRVGVNSWLRFPSLACEVQSVLGAHRASAADVSAGCAGFIYAVRDAHDRLVMESSKGRDGTALVLGVDAVSRIVDWGDRSTSVLFGDGAGAVVMKRVPTGGILEIDTRAEGRYGDLLSIESPVGPGLMRTGEATMAPAPRDPVALPAVHMEGPKVYARAVEAMVREIRTVLDRHNEAASRHAERRPLGIDDIDFLIPHQANLRIIEKVAERLGFPLERVYTRGVERYGNTSAASIPIGYADLFPRPAGSIEVDVSFGAGFASGAILRMT